MPHAFLKRTFIVALECNVKESFRPGWLLCIWKSVFRAEIKYLADEYEVSIRKNF